MGTRQGQGRSDKASSWGWLPTCAHLGPLHCTPARTGWLKSVCKQDPG